MFTYQIRKRVLRLTEHNELTWPAKTEIRFHLQPLQPFGMEAGSGRTTVQNAPATGHFNANSGAHTIESKSPLSPLDLVIEELNRVIKLKGNILSITGVMDSLAEFDETVQSVFFGFPILLNLDFGDPPIVERVDGSIGSIPFRWELAEWRMSYCVTSQERQESLGASAWNSFDTISANKRRRLTAALHYFHVACRLSRRGETVGEFLPEVLLNLAKTLEALFPPPGDGRTRDAVRTGLRQLGYANEEVESSFMPTLALRNEIDVGHVELGLFTRDQLSLLHAYAERAEDSLRDMLGRVMNKVKSGEFEITPYELELPNQKITKLFERLRRHTPIGAV